MLNPKDMKELEFAGDKEIADFKEKFGVSLHSILRQIAFQEEHTIYMMLDYENL